MKSSRKPILAQTPYSQTQAPLKSADSSKVSVEECIEKYNTKVKMQNKKSKIKNSGTLVIVESPTKARTISRFLNNGFTVESSVGHIRDLPSSSLGIDVENNFEPKYIVPRKKSKVVKELKALAQKSDRIILATDEDREGEAIAWHLAAALGIENPERIVFHEITESAIIEALKSPRVLDMYLIDAQQARRVLDRLVGYKLSPFLWKKVMRGLSPGRVQSVALRIIVEREREIQKFVQEEYWEIEALLGKTKKEFTAFLFQKEKIKNKKEVDKILKDLNDAEYRVANIEKKEVKRNPFPPFTTSTLQQAAWQKFHFPAKMTMQLAQRLYENGLITYHRTDSLNLSGLSLATAKKFIMKN